MGVRYPQEMVFSGLIEGAVSKHQAIQKERQEQSVSEKSRRPISTTVCVCTCVYVVYGVCPCWLCVDEGVSVSVSVYLYECVCTSVVCTSRTGMDWSFETRNLPRSFL